MFVEVMARQSGNLRPFATKASLRRALEENAAGVTITSVGGLHGDYVPSGPVPLIMAKYPEHTLSVTGPDPRTNRKWYGTLYFRRDGSIALK